MFVDVPDSCAHRIGAAALP